MPLLVNPIIYTSFPKVGFQSLASSSVPIEVQQAFLEQIVHQQWDTYDPPPTGYRAVYLYQVAPDQVIFGWLYNDGHDDLGRANIPYFMAYHLKGILNRHQLDILFNCLELGPPVIIDRQNPPKQLENLVIPDGNSYQPLRRGLSIPNHLRQQAYQDLQHRQLLRLFIPVQLPDPTTFLTTPFEEIPTESSLPKTTLDELLEGFVRKPIGIQGAVLVSQEGQLMSQPVGIEEETATILAGRMLYLAQSTQDELQWQNINHITLRSPQGHLILSQCNPQTFILVQSGKGLTGLLEAEINRFIKQLQPALDNPETFTEIIEDTPLSSPLPPLTAPEKPPAYELTLNFLEEEEEISYRGRKLSS